jgi:hypothetical protein
MYYDSAHTMHTTIAEPEVCVALGASYTTDVIRAVLKAGVPVICVPEGHGEVIAR